MITLMYQQYQMCIICPLNMELSVCKNKYQIPKQIATIRQLCPSEKHQLSLSSHPFI